MPISATAATTPTHGLTPPAPPATSSAMADKETFMQLLVAQLRYQDPLNPTDQGQFLAQTAQFTALEKMQEVSDQTAALASATLAFGATSLVGRQVSYVEGEETRTGLVSGVRFGSNGPELSVDGKFLSLGVIQSVTAPPTAAPPEVTDEL